MATVNQKTAAPVRKVAAGGVAGAIVTVAVWLVSFAGIQVPDAVAAALTAIIMFVVAYLVPASTTDV